MKRFTFTMLLMTIAAGLFATAQRKELQLQVAAQYGQSDQTAIYFDLGVNPTFNSIEDGAKIMSSIPGRPNIYSLSADNIKCQENGYSSLAQSAVINIGLLLDSSAYYTFTLQQLNNFDSTTLVILEDRQLHVFTEMQNNFYQVHLTTQDTMGRFFLHITRAVQLTVITAGCSNNDGAISISADSAFIWNTVSLFDSNVLVTSYMNAHGQFVFNNLAEGPYLVAFNYNGYASTKVIFVTGNHITVGITASSQNVAVGETIDFFSAVINTTQYVWDFGDSTIETGMANPIYFYYIPGIFTVTLTCTNNAGCSAQAQMIIDVGQATGISSSATKGFSIIHTGAKTIEITMNSPVQGNAELQVYNILGQAIYASPITSNEMLVSLSDQPTGIYLVAVKNGTKSTTTKIYIN